MEKKNIVGFLIVVLLATTSFIVYKYLSEDSLEVVRDSSGKIKPPESKRELKVLAKTITDENIKDYSTAISGIKNKDLVSILCEYAEEGIGGLDRGSNNYFRISAIKALGNLKDERAIETLKDLLDEKDGISCFASLALGEIGDSSVIPEMIKNMEKTEFCSTAGIGMFGEEGLNSILEALNDPQLSENEKNELKVVGISSISDPEAKPLLKELFKSGDYKVTTSAGQALLNMVTVDDIDYFKQGFEKGYFDKDDINWVILALKNIKDPRVIPILEDIYNEMTKGSPDWQYSFKALASLKGEEFCPEAMKYINDSNKDVRATAIKALQYCHSQDLIDILLEIIDPGGPTDVTPHMDDSKLAALQALEDLNSIEAFNASKILIKSKHESIANGGIRIAENFAKEYPEYKPIVKEVLLEIIEKDSSRFGTFVRIRALTAFVEIMGKESIPYLEKYSEDLDYNFSRYALGYLKDIKEDKRK